MKTIYFIRHAKSSWDDPSLRDIERPLNKRGKRDAPFMAKLLKGKNVKPDLIISSPANRAFTTASFFAEELGIEQDEIRIERQIYEAIPHTVFSIIRSIKTSYNTVLVFGHNPTFTNLANYFTDDYIANVPTCGIVKIESDIEDWSGFDKGVGKQTAFYFPKQYF